MGNWNMNIQGLGFHHGGAPADADRMFAKFVDELRAAGHSLQVATFTHGSAQGEAAAADWSGVVALPSLGPLSRPEAVLVKSSFPGEAPVPAPAEAPADPPAPDLPPAPEQVQS